MVSGEKSPGLKEKVAVLESQLTTLLSQINNRNQMDTFESFGPGPDDSKQKQKITNQNIKEDQTENESELSRDSEWNAFEDSQEKGNPYKKV